MQIYEALEVKFEFWLRVVVNQKFEKKNVSSANDWLLVKKMIFFEINTILIKFSISASAHYFP